MTTGVGRYLAAICTATFVAGGALAWLAFFQTVSPLESQRLIRMDAVNQGGSRRLVVTRQFCFSRSSEAEAIRVFRRIPDRETEVAEVFETQPSLVHLDGGCYVRARAVEIPDGVSPGRYSYQTGLRFSNNIGRYQTVWLPAVTIVLDERDGRREVSIERIDEPETGR